MIYVNLCLVLGRINSSRSYVLHTYATSRYMTCFCVCVLYNMYHQNEYSLIFHYRYLFIIATMADVIVLTKMVRESHHPLSISMSIIHIVSKQCPAGSLRFCIDKGLLPKTPYFT